MMTDRETKLYDGVCDCGHSIEHHQPKPDGWGTRLNIKVECNDCGSTVTLFLEGFNPEDERPEWFVDEPDVQFQTQTAVADGGVSRDYKSQRLAAVVEYLDAVHEALDERDGGDT